MTRANLFFFLIVPTSLSYCATGDDEHKVNTATLCALSRTAHPGELEATFYEGCLSGSYEDVQASCELERTEENTIEASTEVSYYSPPDVTTDCQYRKVRCALELDEDQPSPEVMYAGEPYTLSEEGTYANQDDSVCDAGVR